MNKTIDLWLNRRGAFLGVISTIIGWTIYLILDEVSAGGFDVSFFVPTYLYGLIIFTPLALISGHLLEKILK